MLIDTVEFGEAEFLPERIRQRRLRRRRLVRQGYLLASCIAIMGVLTYVRHERIVQEKINLAAMERLGGSLHRQVTMIEPLESQMADLLIKKRIDEELGSRTDCTAVLAELCRVTPLNVSMISLEMKTVELKVEGYGKSGLLSSGPHRINRGVRPVAAARGMNPYKPVSGDSAGGVRRVRVVVTGLAPSDVDVANFIGQLSASPLFENVNMGYSRTVVFCERSARQFQASCYLAM